jgi:hypothetical protein
MPKQDFQERLQSLFNSLCFISKQHGLYKFGYEETSERQLKVSATVQYEAGCKDLLEHLQADLQGLAVWRTAQWQAVPFDHNAYAVKLRTNFSSASTLEEQAFESLKLACRLSLRLLEDHHSKLMVFEFTLEPLTTPAG